MAKANSEDHNLRSLPIVTPSLSNNSNNKVNNSSNKVNNSNNKVNNNNNNKVNNKNKVIIKSSDMLPQMLNEVVDIALASFEKYNLEKEVAEHIKKEFDKKHGPTWHCIVGRSFGSYVTHETNHFVYFYLDQKAVLLFKSG